MAHDEGSGQEQVMAKTTAKAIAVVLLSATVCFTAACDKTTPGSGSAADSLTPATERAYLSVCANCHLDTGKGMAPAYRSLVGSRWATGAPTRAIAIVLYGVQGPVVDSAYTYHTSMLPYGSGAALRDEDVAAALTHVRTSWGNQASAVTAADVAAARRTFSGRTKGFTQAELDAMDGAPPRP